VKAGAYFAWRQSRVGDPAIGMEAEGGRSTF